MTQKTTMKLNVETGIEFKINYKNLMIYLIAILIISWFIDKLITK